MLCQHCLKNQANTTISKTVNGHTLIQKLCVSCAAEMGYGELLQGFSFGLPDLFGSLLEQSPQRRSTHEQRCPFCGCSFSDIAALGKMGCATCYTTFYDQLLPTFQRLHGHSAHEGKRPAEKSARAQTKAQLASLQKQLEQAVAAQEYEQAALLRDQIKTLESKGGEPDA